MGLRDQLAAKARRHASYPVQVADPVGAGERVGVAEAALRVLNLDQDADPAEVERARTEVADARRALEACFVQVEFQALTPADFEALVVTHTLEDAGDGEPGINRKTMLPALAAACAVDEDLRDETWWAAQFDPETTTWTKGEQDSLWVTLFTQLHYTVPRGVLGKG